MAIGYACLTVDVPDTKLSRCILKNASPDHLRVLIRRNLEALSNIIDYNKENNIKLFRISSDIIPFGSHPVNQLRWWEEFQLELDQLSEKIKAADIRVSMHPGQYTLINSPNKEVVERAFMDLVYHDRFLTSLHMDEKSKLILHVGGVYGDKSISMQRFIKEYYRLPNDIKKRLVIENDDINYNIEEVTRIYEEVGAPVVFDNLHHKINPPSIIKEDYDWISACADTWSKKDGKQKLHYSQQKEGGKSGSHSDTIDVLEFMNYYDFLPDRTIDIMLEVKDKNLSAVKCLSSIRENSEI